MKFQYLVEKLLNEAHITDSKYVIGEAFMIGGGKNATKTIKTLCKKFKCKDSDLIGLKFTLTNRNKKNVTLTAILNGKSIQFDANDNSGIVLYKEIGKGSPTEKTECQETASLVQIQNIIDTNKTLSYENLGKVLSDKLPPRIFALFDMAFYNSSVEHANSFKKNYKINGKYSVKMQSEIDTIYKLASGIVKKNNNSDDNEKHVWSGKDNWNPGDIWVINEAEIGDIHERLSIVTSCSEFDSIINDEITKNNLIPISLKLATINKGKYKYITHKSVIESIPTFGKIADIRISDTGKDAYIHSEHTNFKIRIMGKGNIENVYFEGQEVGAKVQLGAINKKAMKTITVPKYSPDFPLIDGKDNVTSELRDLHKEILSFYKKRQSYLQPIITKFGMSIDNILKIEDIEQVINVTKILFNTIVFIKIKENLDTKLQNEFLQQCYLYAMKINDHSTNYIKLS